MVKAREALAHLHAARKRIHDATHLWWIKAVDQKVADELNAAVIDIRSAESIKIPAWSIHPFQIRPIAIALETAARDSRMRDGLLPQAIEQLDALIAEVEKAAQVP